MRGYYGVGIYMPKKNVNIGTLWRSAFQMGASFCFTIGRPDRIQQASDTVKSHKHMPFYVYETFEHFQEARPHGAKLVAVEMGGEEVQTFTHPQTAIYLLGREDAGLPDKIIKSAQCHISLPSIRTPSFNVAVAGSIVLYDRFIKSPKGNKRD